MFTIRKKFTFEAAHRLRKAYSAACVEQIHGHSYVVEVFLSADTLNDDGMVIDFGELKNLVGDYIKSWDHSLILNKASVSSEIRDTNVNLKEVDYNPTAEEMARDMFVYICMRIKRGGYEECALRKVRIHETDTGWAEYSA